MTAAFVLDASIAMTWCFKDEATEETTALLLRLERESAIVLEWWSLEITNVLAMAERRGRIDRTATDAFIDSVRRLPLQIDTVSHGRAFSHLLELCRTHSLTVYDALYLDLAIRRRLPLATLDKGLRAAAKQVGVPLLGC